MTTLSKNSMLTAERCSCGTDVLVSSDGVRFDVKRRHLLVRPSNESWRPVFGEALSDGGVRLWMREAVHVEHDCPAPTVPSRPITYDPDPNPWRDGPTPDGQD